jgi:hypothetical protein
MQRARLVRSAPIAFALAIMAAPAFTSAQQTQAHQHGPAVAKEQLTTFAKAFAAVAKVRDQVQAELAEPRNKKDEAQAQLHEKLRTSIAKIIQEHGFTEEQYNRLTYAVSTDNELRKAFDELLGIKPPTPTATAAPAAGGPLAAHLAHVTTAFNGTPNNQGLLATAVAEAKVVAQHAALAAKPGTDLETLKKHAGHIIHAVDPTVETTGPGAGYGLKKAAAAVAQHIEMAGKAEGAPAAVANHATHVATSAKNVAARADQIVALAKQIQAASSTSDAAALVTQLNTLAEQLTAGVDANGDGRIGWQEGEGGLQHVEQHVGLLVEASKGA